MELTHMTYLKQARDYIQRQMDLDLTGFGAADPETAILGYARYLDEKEKARPLCGKQAYAKHNDVVYVSLCDYSTPCPIHDAQTQEQEKPKCEHEMLPRLKCNKPKGHEGNHATDEVQPTPVPEELHVYPPSRHQDGFRYLEDKLNELIRYLRSLQPRNQ